MGVPARAVLPPSAAVLSAALTIRRTATSALPATAGATASKLAGTTRVHSMALSARGSPDATLCGNFQSLPVARGTPGSL